MDALGDNRSGVRVEAGESDHADQMPPDDPIVAEVRAVRETLFAEAGNDLDEFVRRVRVAQARSGHPIVTLPPKLADSAA